MIIAIDGTGPASDAGYTNEMAGSFCYQVAAQAPGATYFRGPSLLGSQTSAIADRAVGAAIAGKASPTAGNLALVGYSRGGCAAILAAARLKTAGVTVHSLFLFDAVDMQTSDLHLSQTISDNVSFVAHARSARNLGFWARNPVKSRFYFYNTGRFLAGAGTYETKSFVGSHGALGGVSWPNIPEDPGCKLAVADWMNSHFKSRGYPVTLKG